jgi:hypothetical protein
MYLNLYFEDYCLVDHSILGQINLIKLVKNEKNIKFRKSNYL